MVGGKNRYLSRKKALRKRKIDGFYLGGRFPWYDNLHQYSKNKIHCSCPLCSSKTRNISYKISDLRKVQAMDYQERDSSLIGYMRSDDSVVGSSPTYPTK